MVFKITLLLHIASGVSAFAFGIWSLITKKGSTIHIKTGKWFTRLMTFSSVTALVLATIKPQHFLFAIGVFTLYLLFYGMRAIRYYRLQHHFNISNWDIVPHYAMFLFALYVFIRPIALMNSMDMTNLMVRLYGAGIMVGCSLMGLMAVRNKRNFIGRKPFWLRHHIAMMCGAFVSSASALIINVFRYEPWWIFWTLPSLVGILIIQWTIHNYKKQAKLPTKRSLTV